MKTVKSFGLLVAVVVFAMALLGPAGAMAETTALCKADESPCKSTSLVTHVHYTSNDLEVLTSFGNYKCDALYLASVALLGSPQVLQGEFTYSNCDKGCTREEVNPQVVLDLLKTGHESAELIGTPGAGVKSECKGGFELGCVYSFEELIGTVTGPLLATSEKGEITYEEQPLVHVSGLLCPAEAYLDARFVLLSPTYISS
jgi:hypothetical protein